MTGIGGGDGISLVHIFNKVVLETARKATVAAHEKSSIPVGRQVEFKGDFIADNAFKPAKGDREDHRWFKRIPPDGISRMGICLTDADIRKGKLGKGCAGLTGFDGFVLGRERWADKNSEDR